jgi:tRNA-modifying protein YgfZ
MGDRDRANLLQRLSTNDVVALQPGQGIQTVLTNHNGRTIDLLTVHALEDRLLIVTSSQQRNAVRNLLRKNIFFNDKVKLEDASATLGQLHLYGPQSAATLQTLTGDQVDDLPLHGIAPARIGEVDVWIARIKPLGGASFALYAPTESLPALWDALRAGGAQPLGSAAASILRIESGYGVYGRELSLDYIPLETGLLDAISFTKGCYVGQEIIARMESRGRMAKQLRGLKLTGLPTIELADANNAHAGPQMPLARLSVDGKEAGDLTSVAISPRFGPIGLAYVRTAHAAPGTTVGIAGSDMMGTVVELPFG